MPDHKRRARRASGSHQYFAAAGHFLTDASHSMEPLRPEPPDLAREFQQVSYVMQELAALPVSARAGVHARDSWGMDDSRAVDFPTLPESNRDQEEERARVPVHITHHTLGTVNVVHVADERAARGPVAEQELDQSGKTDTPPRRAEPGGQQDVGNDRLRAADHAHDQAGRDLVDDENTKNWRSAGDARGSSPGAVQSKAEFPDQPGTSPTLNEVLRQQDRILLLSQNLTANQMEVHAVMAQHSARINQLIAQQRQLQSSWRMLRTEDQNRTQQNMGWM